MSTCFLLNFSKFFFYFSAFLNSQIQCIFSMYLYWKEKTPKRVHTKEQSFLVPEIDVCLWGNPACYFQDLQVHCKLNHVAFTQIIPSFQNHSSELPIALFPCIFLYWSAPTKPQLFAREAPRVVGHQPAICVSLFITATPSQTLALFVCLLLFSDKIFNKKRNFLQ